MLRLDIVHMIIDFVWLITTIALIYFGWDAHQQLSAAHKETTVPKSMIVVGVVFLLLAAFHIEEDLLGAPLSPAIHIVPFVVLAYTVYEYRRLIREAHLAT